MIIFGLLDMISLKVVIHRCSSTQQFYFQKSNALFLFIEEENGLIEIGFQVQVFILSA